jgi:hypothetical protein
MSKSKNFALSTKGLATIPRCEERNDFAFIVGNCRYHCPWIIVDFLSPRLCKLHSVDCSVCEFLIETRDAESVFESFIDLGFGHSLEIRDLDRRLFISLSRELWNQELYDALVGSDLTQANAFERLEFLEELKRIGRMLLASSYRIFPIFRLGN